MLCQATMSRFDFNDLPVSTDPSKPVPWIRGSRFLAVGVALAALAGCAANSGPDTGSTASSVERSDGSGGASAASGDDGASGSNAAANTDESCTATFHWLQKDAYKNTGGRTDQAWPPHTTTQVDVVCNDADGNETFRTSTYRENHGTAPGALDPNGRVYLDEVKNATTTAPRATLEAFVANYKQCECEPVTTFLSLDSVKGDTEKAILGQVESYITAHLQCTGDTSTSDLVGMINAGDYTNALAALPSCTWDDGYGWPDAFSQATQSVVSSLSDYHVCNNDAKLQASIWDTLVATGEATACDNTGDVCHGPSFFYNP
jgi:hypothetical protein